MESQIAVFGKHR